MSRDWTTVAFNPLPPGWVNVWEQEGDPLFFTLPCPGVLVEECVEDGERVTRTVAAKFDEGYVVPAMDANGGYITTETVEVWEEYRATVTAEVLASREWIKADMLTKLAEAGAEGVHAGYLLAYPHHRAFIVRDALERDGLVTLTRHLISMQPSRTVAVYRLASATAKAVAPQSV